MMSASAVNQQGFAVVEDVVPTRIVASLLQALSAVDENAGPAVHKRGGIHARRNLLEVVPEVQHLARSPEIRSLVEPLLGAGAFAVRGFLFDKVPHANWKVTWHQDLTIAVGARQDVPGFGPWSEKAGVIHVQPPTEVLERMVTVRLHLDDCTLENGPVQVMPGSHAVGRLNPEAIAGWRAHNRPVTCTSARGGVLLMRPLILHASSPAVTPAHRRVVHLEFAAEDLPDGLEWHGRW